MRCKREVLPRARVGITWWGDSKFWHDLNRQLMQGGVSSLIGNRDDARLRFSLNSGVPGDGSSPPGTLRLTLMRTGSEYSSPLPCV